MVNNCSKLGHRISFRLNNTYLYELKETYRITSNERPWFLFNFHAFLFLKTNKKTEKMTTYKIICNKNSKETENTQALVELVMQIFKYFSKNKEKPC